jgi:hypothetical protein
MANGNQHCSVENWAKYFEPIAADIESFASARDLRLVRYDRDTPTWMLEFLHPVAGIGRIAVAAHSQLEVVLRAFVYSDNFDQGARTTRTFQDRIVARSGPILLTALNKLLDEMVLEQYDGETIVTSGLRESWATFTAEEFRAASSRGLRRVR